MSGEESSRDGGQRVTNEPESARRASQPANAEAPGSPPGEDAGDDPWRADRPDAVEDLGSLWIRWTDGGSDLHLHRVSHVVPQVRPTPSWPFLRVVPEDGDRPTFQRVEDADNGVEEEAGDEQGDLPGDDTAHGTAVGAADGTGPDRVQFRFLSGLPRFLLRHTPLVVVVAAAILLVGAEVTPGVQGVSILIPTVTGRNAMLFTAYLLLLPVLLWLLSVGDLLERREFGKAAVVYGIVIALAGGVAIAVFLVVTASHPSETPDSVVFVSGYLLVLLLGGQLLYEATLRIEHLFVTLGERDGDIVGDHRAYRRFLTDLHDALRIRVAWLSPSRLFGLVFAAQFAIFWLIGEGPQNLGYTLGIGVNFALNAVLATVAYQFLVLVRYFNLLLNETSAYSDVDLRYEPFHVDGHGGFRDFGRFASRINVILTLAGAYLVYRLYVVGTRGLPVEGIAGFTDPILLTVWVLSFAGPVVAYALGAGAWGYYSFWALHAKMVRDKYRLARRYQGTQRDVDRDRTPAAGDRIDSFDSSEGPSWAALQAAPTWPLDVNKMASLVSGNLLPLVVPILGFL